MVNLENYNSTELIGVFSPLIEPLKKFEALVDKEERTKKNYQMRQKNVYSSRVWIYILVPIVSLIAFTILNIKVMIANPPSFLRLMVLAVIGLPILYFYLYFKPIMKKESEDLMIEEERVLQEIKDAQIAEISPYWDQISDYVPTNYQNSFAVSSFCSYLQNGRASNLKEAINLYEEELHRYRMEQMQSQILQQQKYQTSLAAVSAAANVATAFNTASAAASLSSINDRL
ncbi:hypothetical protein [Butyrivibrio sp. AE2032]|uniref:hypothetical protein n=1 Tax=Butyrivibrio sp. AE2032 TaxID=1458463 RepID=UPI0005544129|nr:hypothetical protein [Butyrivibrio sp. AE2032]